jgi:serine-type D-Ala-D-Ala carboxypeptidase
MCVMAVRKTSAVAGVRRAGLPLLCAVLSGCAALPTLQVPAPVGAAAAGGSAGTAPDGAGPVLVADDTTLPAAEADAEAEWLPDDYEAGTAPTPREVAPELAGFHPARLAQVDSIVLHAINEGAAPGAAVVIGRYGQVVRMRGYGRTDWLPVAPEVTDSTLYDLASLTKSLGTSAVATQLIMEGQLLLDEPIHRYLAAWPGHGLYGRITARHLLSHTSGLPAGHNMWTATGSRAERLATLAALPVRHEPGTRREYSDVGMILLATVLESISGQRLDQMVQQRIVAPLAMRDTRFNPLDPHPVRGGFTLQQIAPTELDSYVRRAHVHGVVHDLNAWALDGVAGHAGMFSSARDLAVYAQVLLDAAQGRTNPLFPGELYNSWLSFRPFDRPLGWDAPTGPNSSAGQYFTHASFGHTGFTGTSIWIDPERHLFVVLLTNRLNPTARNQRHLQLRRDLHDAVQLAIDDMVVTRRGAFPGCDPLAQANRPLTCD